MKQPEPMNKANDHNGAKQPKTRDSALLLTEAKRHFDEANSLTASALQKARDTGDCLNQAKALVKHGAWTKMLAKVFGGRKRIRRCQEFMQIAEAWGELAGELKRNPELSIDGALRFLRSGRAVPVDPDFHETAKTARDLFSRAFPEISTWTNEDLFVLQTHFDGRNSLLGRKFYKELQIVCACFQSRVKKFAAYRIGLDPEKQARHRAWRVEQQSKERAEDYNGPAVFSYTDPIAQSETRILQQRLEQRLGLNSPQPSPPLDLPSPKCERRGMQ